MREFSIVLLSNLSRGDPSAARIIALNGAAISNLISFLEVRLAFDRKLKSFLICFVHQIKILIED